MARRFLPVPFAHPHIWLDAHGRYAGITDFGEMRGADPFFDAGHFLLHDRETRPQSLFEDFLTGYAKAGPLPEGHRDQIRRSAVLPGLRQLSVWLGPRRNHAPDSRPACGSPSCVVCSLPGSR